jgi:hypothetical protein
VIVIRAGPSSAADILTVSGPYLALLGKSGMSARHIAVAVQQVITRKHAGDASDVHCASVGCHSIAG